ncbi:MAG: outer membrane protein assembly factor, partial [Phycisphaerales bacterium]
MSKRAIRPQSLVARHASPSRVSAQALLLALGLAGGVATGALGQSDPGSTPAPVGTGAPSQPEPAPPDTSIPPALAPLEGRYIREVKVVGLKQVEPQLAQNQIRSKPGQPLSLETVRGDLQRLTRLGRFRKIEVKSQSLADESVVLTYECTETPIIEDVQAVGNRQITVGDLAGVINILKGTPVDRYQIDRAKRQIEDLYRKKGYYLSSVTIDEEELEKRGVLLFIIREGERIRVTDIRFEPFDGRLSFTDGQLRDNIKTREWNWFETAPLDDDVLDNDVAELVNYYRDRGHLDVRVGPRIQTSPNGREAIVTFIIAEGPVYTLRSLKVRHVNEFGEDAAPAQTVYTPEQIKGLMLIKPGDVYSADRLRKSMEAVQEAYGKEGYVDARVVRSELRDPGSPQVDLQLTISEGRRFLTGLVTVTGNQLTKQSVIRRDVEIVPDRPLDTTAIDRSKRKLEETRLFAPTSIKLTIQPEDQERPGYRDVLVEVAETNTGSLGFGVAADSDLGLVGQIVFEQRNFDISDFPDSFGEFISQRAFRGAGQTFNLTLAPGTDIQTYSISLSDPRLFDSDYSGSISGAYRKREYRQYDEQRIGSNLSIGRRFGERWSGALTFRVAQIELADIDADAPVDVFNVEDANVLTGIGARLTRYTSDSRFRPTNGTRLELAAEQVGAFGGDFDFTRFSASYTVYLPVYESFLGAKTVLSLKTAVGYIPQSQDDVPVYERFYLGGRDFRGFDFRTVSPKGIRNDTMTLGDDPVGGTWSFFAGAEVDLPIWKDVCSGVGFRVTGTVTIDVGCEVCRAGGGL